MRTKLVCILLIIGMFFSPSLVIAQDELTQTYSSPDSRISFSYPQGWIALEIDTETVRLFSSQDVIDRVFTGDPTLYPGEVNAAFLGAEAGMFSEAPTDASPTQRLLTLLASLTEVSETRTSTTTTNGRAAAFAELTDFEGMDGIVFVIDIGDGFIAATFFFAPGEFSHLESTIMAMVDSFSYGASTPFDTATHSSGFISQYPRDPDCLRVQTYNIHGGYTPKSVSNLENVARLTQLNGADISLIQEVNYSDAEWLANELGMVWVFYQLDDTGIAVLSRVPIIGFHSLSLPDNGSAGVLYVQLDPDQLAGDPLSKELGNLDVYNVYLGEYTEDTQDQSQQITSLLNWIATQQAPTWANRIILGGSFNFGPDNPLYLAFSGPSMTDPFSGLSAEDAATVYFTDGTAARYDYLWTLNLPLGSAGVDHSPEATETSDHRPAIVAFSRREGLHCPP
jgi:endonuclease/exonuclease/phosphatase family metal-dependent hydrolase